MEKIRVLSVGPGSPELVAPLVRREAGLCATLAGGRRNLDHFALPHQDRIEIKEPFSVFFAALRRRRRRGRVGVLVSGDAGVFSILPRLVEEFGRKELEVYPGISAAQYLMARIGRSWQEAHFVSLHGRRGGDPAALAAAGKTVIVFTDAGNSPDALCRQLVAAGLGACRVWVAEDLSYPQQKIDRGRAADFTAWRGSNLNLVVIEGDTEAAK